MAPYGATTESVLLVMTLALRAMNPRLLLFFFLLALVHTYRIPVRSEKSVYDPDEIYYMNGNIRCLRCSPGTFVLKQCDSPDTQSTCAPCLPEETYSEHLTGLTYCLPCTVCRTDQEEVSPCTVTKNTICQCKKGTYCPPGDPCELCQKCTASCPSNQVIHTPCNSTSDTECGPPEIASNTLKIVLPVGLVIFLLLAAACVWFCWRRSCAASRWLLRMLTASLKCDQTQDIETPFLPQGPKLHFKENMSQNEKNEVINKTFNAFLDIVPTVRFEKFMRELGLTCNEIERAKLDNIGDTYNQHHAMLTLLHQDQQFDVNVWLNKLHAIKMGKVAQDITDKLTKDGLFVRSTEG